MVQPTDRPPSFAADFFLVMMAEHTRASSPQTQHGSTSPSTRTRPRWLPAGVPARPHAPRRAQPSPGAGNVPVVEVVGVEAVLVDGVTVLVDGVTVAGDEMTVSGFGYGVFALR